MIHQSPFTDAPSDTPLIYYRPGWASRLPVVIREINGQRILFADRGAKMDAVASLPTDAILESPISDLPSPISSSEVADV